MSRIRTWRFALMLAGSVLAAACRIEATDKSGYPPVAVGQKVTRNLDTQCVADFDPAVDYFPDRIAFTHSSQLRVTYGSHWKRVTFTPSIETGETMEFLLVQCGTPVPARDPRTIVVSVPVSRIVTAERSMLGAADELAIVDRIVGMDEPCAATVQSVKRRVERGLIVEAGGYTHGSIEATIAAQPDVYLTFYSAYPQYNMHPKLWALGVRALPHADRLEVTPLGRAEWIKFLGLLVNREAQADALFADIEKEYAQLAMLAQRASTKPKVMAGFASGRSVFELFGGRNQRSRIIADAGGEYVLAHDRFSGGLLRASFERVYVRGFDAPCWIGTQAGLRSVESLSARNPLNGWFRAATERQVYALDQGYRGLWSYHYEDQSMIKPHVLLAETIAVLHPELRAEIDPAEGFFFMRKLP